MASRVSLQPDGDAEVEFAVTEGRPLLVRSLTVRGLEPFAGRLDLPDELPLRAGQPYATPRLEATQRLIAGQLGELGYPFALVEAGGAVSQPERAADVVLEVRPGPRGVFGRTEIGAEPPLTERDVRRRLAYAPGGVYDPGALERTAERLYALPIVETAALRPTPGAAGDSTVDVRVAVSARRVTAYQAEAIASSSTCLGGQARVGTRYFLGAPRSLVLSGGGSNLFSGALRGFPCTGGAGGDFDEPDDFVRAELREPVGPDTWLMLDGAFARESSPRAYVRRGVQGRLAVAHSPAGGLVLLGGWAPERGDNEAAAPFFCVLYARCAGPALAEAAGGGRWERDAAAGEPVGAGRPRPRRDAAGCGR